MNKINVLLVIIHMASIVLVAGCGDKTDTVTGREPQPKIIKPAEPVQPKPAEPAQPDPVPPTTPVEESPKPSNPNSPVPIHLGPLDLQADLPQCTDLSNVTLENGHIVLQLLNVEQDECYVINANLIDGLKGKTFQIGDTVLVGGSSFKILMVGV